MNFFRTANGTPVRPQGYIPAQSCKPANAPAMPAPQASYRTAANPFAQPAVQPAMPYPGAYAPQPPAGAPHAPQSPGFPNAPQAPQPPLGGIPAGAPMNVAATHTNDASVEAWFGAKFLGVVAAILVLAGIALFAVTFIPALPDSIKALALLVCSLALATGGTLLAHRQRNVFTLALFTCGVLATFFSIYATGAIFELAPAGICLAAMALWMAVSIGLVMLTRTWPLALALALADGFFGIALLEPLAQSMGTPALAFAIVAAYGIALAIAGVWLNRAGAADNAGATADTLRTRSLACIFSAQAALLVAAIASTWDCAAWLAFDLLAVSLLVTKLAPLPAPLDSYGAKVALRVDGLTIKFASAFAMSYASLFYAMFSTPALAMIALFVAMAAILLVARAVDAIKGKAAPYPAAFAVLEAIAATAIVLAFVIDVLGIGTSGYAWSAITMACSLAAVLAGFAANHKPLRLYGLIATIVCVFKIALLDTAGGTLEHAVALLIAGAVCFAVSALYSFAAKRLEQNAGAPSAQEGPLQK